MNRTLLAFIYCALLLSSTFAQQSSDVAERAKKLHFSSLILDTHIDVTPKLQTDWKFAE